MPVSATSINQLETQDGKELDNTSDEVSLSPSNHAQLACLFLIFLCFSPVSLAWNQECDLSKPETAPNSRFRRYEEVGVEIISDTMTKLHWKRCPEGMRFIDGTCRGTAITYTPVVGAVRFAFEGSGWRLPNPDELASLMEDRCSRPNINLTAFPMPMESLARGDLSFMTSASGRDSSGKRCTYLVSFKGYGRQSIDVGCGFMDNKLAVLLVRGNQWYFPRSESKWQRGDE